MAPRAPSTWRRPYTAIYNDNYRYGNSLYSDTLSDIEKKYNESLSKTQLRSDRGDLNFSTFADSTLASSPNPAGESAPVKMTLPPRESSLPFRSTFESRLNSALHSSYASDESPSERRARSLDTYRSRHDDREPLVSTLARVQELPETDAFVDVSKKRRKGKESPLPESADASFWMDKCRDLQNQLDSLSDTVTNVESKVKGDLSGLRTRFQVDLTDLSVSIDQSSQQSNELQKMVKKQSNQLLELQSAYDDLQRHLQDSVDLMAGCQRRCQSLRADMDNLRVGMEQMVKKSESTSRM